MHCSNVGARPAELLLVNTEISTIYIWLYLPSHQAHHIQTDGGHTLEQRGALLVPDSHRDTVIGGYVQEESILGGIIILLRPAPIKDSFWKPHKFMP